MFWFDSDRQQRTSRRKRHHVQTEHRWGTAEFLTRAQIPHGNPPWPDLTDRHHEDFTEVFFDGVVVPRDHLVGTLHHGWSISAGSLAPPGRKNVIVTLPSIGGTVVSKRKL